MLVGSNPSPDRALTQQARSPYGPIVVHAAGRTPFAVCPLCRGAGVLVREVPCDGHPSYVAGLPSIMRWNRCDDCGHVYTEGFFDAEALSLLFSSAHDSQTPGDHAESQRFVWAPTVEKVTSYVSYPLGVWLDVGMGNGSLLFTAAEWGYEPVGLDMRPQTVERMSAFGVESYCCDLLQFEPIKRMHVISLCDVLEHVPYPRRVLQKAKSLLVDDGVLLLSMPNIESPIWRMLDEAGANPYWSEIEHYHNFSRSSLVALLQSEGFEFVHYAVSRRWRVTMEVVARPACE